MDIDVSDREHYEGSASIYFTIREENVSPLTLDFEQGNLLSLEVNGSAIELAYEKRFIRIASDHLVAGEDRVVVRYRRPIHFCETK